MNFSYPDLFFIWKGIFYGIEVKTEKEFKWGEKKIELFKGSYSPKNKKETHLWEQWRCIEMIKKQGSKGFFTYSVVHCSEILGL